MPFDNTAEPGSVKFLWAQSTGRHSEHELLIEHVQQVKQQYDWVV